MVTGLEADTVVPVTVTSDTDTISAPSFLPASFASAASLSPFVPPM